MTTKPERREILDLLEDSYRSELAVHLYSALLWRRINPNYDSKWSNWPLRALDVPCPKTSTKYTDTIVEPDRYGHDIEVDEEATTLMLRDVWKKRNDKGYHRVINMPLKKRKIDIMVESQFKNEDIESDHDSDEFASEDENLNLKRSIIFSERITNSKADLVNELNSQIESKIRERLSKLQKEGKVKSTEISSDMSGDLTKHMSMKLAHKVDDVLNQYTQMRGKPNQKEARWFHILLAALNAEDSPYSSFDPKRYGELYDKCEELFERCDFEYEFDEDAEEDEEMAYIKNEVMASGKFDVKKYLELVRKPEKAATKPKMHPKIDPKQDESYFDLDDGQPPEEPVSDPSLAHQLLIRKLFVSKLKVQSQYNDIVWDRRRVNHYHKRPETLAESRQLAVDSGFNLLDSQEYLLENY